MKHLVRTAYKEPFSVFIDGNFVLMKKSTDKKGVYIFEFEDHRTLLMVFSRDDKKNRLAYIIKTDSSFPKLEIPCSNIHGEVLLFVDRKSEVRKLLFYIEQIKKLNHNSLELDEFFYSELEMQIKFRSKTLNLVENMIEEYRSRMNVLNLLKTFNFSFIEEEL